MPDHFEIYYNIDNKGYWEDELSVSEGGTLFLFKGSLYTREELKRICLTWGVWYNINDTHYDESFFRPILLNMDTTHSISGNTYTRQQLQEIVNGFRHLYSDRPDTTPRPQEDEDEDGEEDELVAKVLANLHIRTEAIKRRKKVAAEVEKLRKLLAEKEADLMECDRVMALEVEQVKAD